jgi:hypothetical protein
MSSQFEIAYQLQFLADCLDGDTDRIDALTGESWSLLDAEYYACETEYKEWTDLSMCGFAQEPSWVGGILFAVWVWLFIR